MGRIVLPLFSVVLGIFLVQRAHGSEREILLAAGGIQTSGTIAWAGTSQFQLIGKDGINADYTISESTLYSPKDRRLALGDSVAIVYFTPEIASGSVLPKIAVYVEIDGAPKFSIKQRDWLDAVVLSSGMQSVITIPTQGKTLRVEGLIPSYEQARQLANNNSSTSSMRFFPNIWEKIRVKLEIVPQKNGGSYVYRVIEVGL